MARCILGFPLLGLICLFACRHEGANDSQPLSTINQPQTSSTNNVASKLETIRFDGEAGGCSNFVVYRTTIDKTKALRVGVDKANLKVSSKPQQFEITKTSELDVIIEDFGTDNYENRIGYCFDLIGVRDVDPIRYKATKGKVTIYTSKIMTGMIIKQQ